MKMRFLFTILISLIAVMSVEAQTIRANQFVFGQSAITASRRILTGAGSPESAVTGPVGTVYLRTDGGTGTTLYIKESGTGNTGWVAVAASTGASTANTYITQTAAADLSAEQAIGGLASGIMRVATTTGVITSLTASADIAANISDETGTGVLVFGTAPAFTTSISTPSIITASGALGITPASGSNLNVVLATTGDFAVNTSQLYVDTSANRVGVGVTTPTGQFEVSGNTAAGTTVGDFLVDSANKTVYVGRLSSTSGDQSTFVVRGRTGGVYISVDPNNNAPVSMPNLDAGAAGDEDVCKDPTTGELTDANASTCIVSSLRYKDVIAPLNTGLAEVLRLHPFSYSLKNDPLKVPQIGLSAEEMFNVEPRLVFFEQAGPDAGKPRGIMYEQSVALLTKAIQELAICVKSDDPRTCLAGIEAGSSERHRSWVRRLLPW